MIDLSETQLKIVKEIFQKFIPHTKICVFGSRVTGKAKPFSDLDLAIMGAKKIDQKIYYQIKDAFDDSNLAIRVDVVDWNEISDEFKNNIKNDLVEL